MPQGVEHDYFQYRNETLHAEAFRKSRPAETCHPCRSRLVWARPFLW
jgi:hypothetical protein